MRQRLIGLALLVAAVAIAWSAVAGAQAKGAAWIGGIIGQERLATDAATVETLFNLLVFAPLLLLGIVGALLDRRNALAPGRRAPVGLALGLILGVGGVAVAILYARLAGVLTIAPPGPPPVATLLLWGLGVVTLQVAAEEVFFRGWLQPALVTRWGAPAGLIAAALAFGALHIAGAPEPLPPVTLVNMVLGGLVFGMLALRAGGLAAAFGMHGGWNASEQLLWGLDPNPGIGSFGAVWDRELNGAALWGGSGQGLNGSIGVTLVLLAILLPLLLLRTRPAPMAPALVTA